MKSIIEDIKHAFMELLGFENEAAVHTLPEESRYRTLCVMAVDMRGSGCSIREIKKWLKVSRREVKKMLKHESVAKLNRRGCRV